MFKLIPILFLITGCAAQLISSSERTVVIRAGSAQAAESQKVADEECKKHGRHARLSLKPTPNEFIYDCVE